MKNIFKIIILLIIILLFVLGYFFINWYFNLSIVLNGEKTITLSYGNEYLDEGVLAQYKEKNITDLVVSKNNINYQKLGEYYIKYNVQYKWFKKSIKRKVIIIDDIKPEITLIGDNPLILTYGHTFVDPGCMYKDNYDQELTFTQEGDDKINNQKPGKYIINYKATDKSGNTTNLSREVIVEDRIVVKNGVTYVEGVLLVNKKYSIPSNYGNGVDIEAYDQLEKLQKKASLSGYRIDLISGYRSYSYQANLYNNYVKKHGQAKADTFSAKPGHSEHQTGLAFDVGKLDDDYGKTDEGKWLSQNAHLYGFIIRYPEGKEKITGYQYEPWHIRYLGVDLATKVYESGLCLEEYLKI